MKKEPIWLVDYRNKNLTIFNQNKLKKSKYFDVQEFNSLLNKSSSKYNKNLDNLKSKNISVFTWEEAIEKIPELIKDILKNEEPPKNQYEAFINSNFNEGYIVLIDKKNIIDDLININMINTNDSILKNIIIVSPEVKNVYILDNYKGSIKLVNQTIFSGENSKVYISRINESSSNSIVNYQSILSKDSSVTILNLYVHNNKLISRSSNNLNGSGSFIKQFDISLINNNEFISLDLTSKHNSEGAVSNTIFKVALNDSSKNLFDGLIKIMPNAQKSNALLQAHSLLLSNNASSNNIPSLEIEADDVKATHSATAFNIDENNLFYMQSRGLNKNESKELIVRGFIEQLVYEMPQSYHSILLDSINKKLGSK